MMKYKTVCRVCGKFIGWLKVPDGLCSDPKCQQDWAKTAWQPEKKPKTREKNWR